MSAATMRARATWKDGGRIGRILTGPCVLVQEKQDGTTGLRWSFLDACYAVAWLAAGRGGRGLDVVNRDELHEVARALLNVGVGRAP